MARTQKTGICVYCGRKARLTKDHIPPKNLFPKPRPGDLITVPSCQDCNNQAAKDDEYFRLVVAVRQGSGEHTAVQQTLPTVLRSLRRSEAAGLTKSFLSRMRPVMLRSASGLYLGRRMGYDVDDDRLIRVLTRIVKGLFFHEKGYRLPDTHEAVAELEPRREPGADGLTDEMKVLAALRAQPVRMLGNGVFSYRFLFTQDDPDCSVWQMTFYEAVHSIGYTLPLGHTDGTETDTPRSGSC